MQRRTYGSTLACGFLFLLLLAGGNTFGQLPRIRLTKIQPVGGQVGTKLSVQISGELTDGATQLVFSHPDIEAIQQVAPETEFQTAHRRPRQFDVQIGDRVPPGRYEVRALGPAGLSAPRSFVVSPLVNITFDSNANSRDNAFPMEVGSAANASSRASERDYYRITAQQHRPLLIQVLAARIDSKTDAVIAIYDSQGKRLEKLRQSLTRDPILTFSPPADGDYIIEVSDSTYQGGEEYFYRLEVSELPHVEAIFPPIAKHAAETKFTVYGYNLPGGLPVSGLERNGHLQSREVTFAPDFENSAMRPGWFGKDSASSVRLNGQFVSLPDQLTTAPPVFVAQSQQDVTRESVSNPGKDNPQAISLPADIAGQFYPRRDRDWYSFDAKKGQTFWIELAAQQFGLPSDPTLRIEQKKLAGDKITYQTVATSDDLEGPPRSRDARRLHSGTPDIAYRFRAPEDGNYILSVADQFNVSLDDPRLTYRLSIQPAKPDYDLLAFADPERFMDEKIAKPNGLGVLPGGSSTIRVRLLPKHGFNKTVRVSVEGLAEGLTAAPIVLNQARTEALLVLQASSEAQPSLSQVRIVGTVEDSELHRYAKPVAIVHGVNNTDATATTSRTASDLTVAVLDCKPSPIALRAKQTTLKTCRGAKLAIPIQVARRDDFKDVEISLSGLQLPAGMKLEAKKSETDKLDATFNATDAKLKAGRFVAVLGAKVKDKRPKKPHSVAEAKADLSKITQLLAAADAELAPQKQNIDKVAIAESKLTERLAAIQSRTSEPRNKLTDNLRQQQTAAKTLSQKLEAALKDVNNADLRTGLAETEERIAELREQRKTLQSQLGEAAKELTDITKQIAIQKASTKNEQDKLAALTAKHTQIQQKQAEADKRLKDAEKADQQEVEFWVYADPIIIDVASSPVQTEVGATHSIQQGANTDLPISIERGFQFNGQVTIEADFPDGSGLSATPLVLGRGITAGKLLVSADDGAKQRVLPIDLKLKMKFNNVELTDQTKTRIKIMPAKPKEQEAP